MSFRVSRNRLLAALFVSMLLLFACSPEQPSGFSSVDMMQLSLDAPALAQYMLDHVSFDDALVGIDGDIAAKLYNVSGLYESISAYGSTGATAEAILVLRCTGAEAAAAAAAKVEKYRAEMAEVYADYNVPESGKLTKALLACDGKYVVFCVSPDTAAAETAYHDFVVSAAG
ncbi:MAG: DUF4358 domain-containing protein [Eubacteriales bacterium]